MRDKIIGTICLILGIVVIVSTGTSFAYFTVSTNTSGDEISGTTAKFDIDLGIEEIYGASQLVPLEDTLIVEAVNNNCVDKSKYAYQVCSLYKITLTNNGDAQILNGYITAEQGTNYITNHLKGQLFNNTLTETISGILTLTDEGTTNTEDKKYFKIDETNLFTTKVLSKETLYLAVWLTETHDFQNEDYSKTFNGKIAFEGLGGGNISAKFST